MGDRRRAWKRGYVVIVLCGVVPGVLLFLSYYGDLPLGRAMEEVTAANQPFTVPDFVLLDVESNIRHLATLRGRVVLLNFWATWCLPCQVEMPSLNALYQEYKDQGLEILSLSSDTPGGQSVLPFLTQYRVGFPVLLDASGEVTRLYGVTSLPTTYLLDREGRLVSVAVGGRDWTQDEAQQLIVQLLNGSDPRRRKNAVEASLPAGHLDPGTRLP
jgi:peroxiredoxin